MNFSKCLNLCQINVISIIQYFYDIFTCRNIRSSLIIFIILYYYPVVYACIGPEVILFEITITKYVFT